MTAPLDNRLLGRVAQGLAGDARSLDALKREAQRDPNGAVKKAAQQFEALFMQMVLKSMREALPKSGMLDSTAQQMYAGMLDEQLATRVAAGGTGLADMIAKQLTRYIHAAGADGIERRASAAVAPPTVGRTAAPAGPVPNGAAGQNGAGRQVHRERTETPGAVHEASAADGAARSADDSVRRRFVLRHWDHALAAERQTGIAAKFIIGQAALESGWGRHEMRDATGRPSHNLFGIKAGPNWRGRTVEVPTTEYENGVRRKVVERFRAYDSYGEAFRDWAQLMTSNPRYAAVLRAGRDAHGFALGLQHAGYATDPQYGAKLARVIGAAAALRGDA